MHTSYMLKTHCRQITNYWHVSVLIYYERRKHVDTKEWRKYKHAFLPYLHICTENGIHMRYMCQY